jgi:hypothetical protein
MESDGIAALGFVRRGVLPKGLPIRDNSVSPAIRYSTQLG